MKREGFDKDFDKTNLGKKSDLIKDKKVNYAQMHLNDRIKKFPMNLIEFIVGVGLLVFCYSYLQSHPAEKSSLFSGIEVIVQKMKVGISQFTEGKGEDLEQKFKLERTYKEIINLATRGECLSETDIKKVEKASKKLTEMSLEDFLEQQRAFSTVANLYYTKVTETCSQ